VIQSGFGTRWAKGPAPGDCWLWTGAVADDGYGRFTHAGGRTTAVRPHRFAFHLATGIPLRDFGPLMHDCDVPNCVRYSDDITLTHLLEGTDRMNVLDRLSKRRDKNGSNFRWRGLSREHFAVCSVELRNEVQEHAPTLF